MNSECLITKVFGSDSWIWIRIYLDKPNYCFLDNSFFQTNIKPFTYSQKCTEYTNYMLYDNINHIIWVVLHRTTRINAYYLRIWKVLCISGWILHYKSTGQQGFFLLLFKAEFFCCWVMRSLFLTVFVCITYYFYTHFKDVFTNINAKIRDMYLGM